MWVQVVVSGADPLPPALYTVPSRPGGGLARAVAMSGVPHDRRAMDGRSARSHVRAGRIALRPRSEDPDGPRNR